ncbi:25419_t:CDS:2, partial [Dentiscutata erythropus]
GALSLTQYRTVQSFTPGYHRTKYSTTHSDDNSSASKSGGDKCTITDRKQRNEGLERRAEKFDQPTSRNQLHRGREETNKDLQEESLSRA